MLKCVVGCDYFSPFYFLARCFFAFWAVISWLMLGHIAASMTGFDTGICLIFFRGLAILLAWNALRPWGKGVNFKQISDKLDDLNRKYK